MDRVIGLFVVTVWFCCTSPVVLTAWILPLQYHGVLALDNCRFLRSPCFQRLDCAVSRCCCTVDSDVDVALVRLGCVAMLMVTFILLLISLVSVAPNGGVLFQQTRLFQKIKRGRFSFHEQYWDPISDAAKDLIARCRIVSRRVASRHVVSPFSRCRTPPACWCRLAWAVFWPRHDQPEGHVSISSKEVGDTLC